MVAETYENDDYYDVTFVVIVFISFLPSVFMPWFFVHWILIGSIKTKGIKTILFTSVKRNNGSSSSSQIIMRHRNSKHTEGMQYYLHFEMRIYMIKIKH